MKLIEKLNEEFPGWLAKNKCITLKLLNSEIIKEEYFNQVEFLYRILPPFKDFELDIPLNKDFLVAKNIHVYIDYDTLELNLNLF